MFNIFKKKKDSEVENTSVTSIACLLIHAAKNRSTLFSQRENYFKKNSFKTRR